MNEHDYKWLIFLCAVIAPFFAGLIMSSLILPFKSASLSDLFEAFMVISGIAVATGFFPGLCSGILLSIIRYRTGRLSLPTVIVVVGFCVSCFVAFFEFYGTTGVTMAEFGNSLSITAVPAAFVSLIMWLLRGRIGLKELAG